MNQHLRKISALLAASLLASTLASCGGSGEPSDTTSPAVSDGTATEAPVTEPAYPPLEDKDFNGKEFNILLRSEWLYEFAAEEQTGDPINDAVYKRNAAVEDRYGVKIGLVDFKGAYGSHEEFTSIINRSVLAGDGEYDIIAGYQAYLINNIQNGDLTNLRKVNHLELDAPWWTQEGLSALSYNGCTYMVGDDIAISMLEGIACMFYNKRLAEDFKTPDLYELVRTGKWTHDAMLSAAKALYQDLDGDGAESDRDRYGLVSPHYGLRSYLVTYDTPTVSPEGEMIWYNDHTVSVLESLVDCFSEQNNYVVKLQDDANKIFTEGPTLLINADLGEAAKLRSMEDDFGIIPYPMFDESQDGYYTSSSNEATMMCIPVTAKSVDDSGFIIEALCRESTETVAKAFYDISLQGKYARDGESLEMIGIIRDSLTFDFGWVGSVATGITGWQYEEMIKKGDRSFASRYASNKDAIGEKLAKYLEAYGE